MYTTCLQYAVQHATKRAIARVVQEAKDSRNKNVKAEMTDEEVKEGLDCKAVRDYLVESQDELAVRDTIIFIISRTNK